LQESGCDAQKRDIENAEFPPCGFGWISSPRYGKLPLIHTGVIRVRIATCNQLATGEPPSAKTAKADFQSTVWTVSGYG
jgi:hypothetical protein